MEALLTTAASVEQATAAVHRGEIDVMSFDTEFRFAFNLLKG